MELLASLTITFLSLLGIGGESEIERYNREIQEARSQHYTDNEQYPKRFLVEFDVENLNPEKLSYLALRHKELLEFSSWKEEKHQLKRAMEKTQSECENSNRYCVELKVLKGHLNRRGQEIEQAIYHWSDIAWRHVDVKAPDAYQEFYEYLVDKKQNSECRKYTLEESTEKVAACLKKDYDRFLKSQAGNKLVELFYQSYTNKYATIPRDLPPFGWMIPAPMSEE